LIIVIVVLFIVLATPIINPAYASVLITNIL
jgi:hypothetical protein